MTPEARLASQISHFRRFRRDMSHQQHILRLAALAVAMSSCRADDPLPAFETIEGDCGNKCRIVIYVCEGGTQAETDYQACFDECLGFKEEALEQGSACAKSFEDMMACIGTLETCEEIHSWALRENDDLCREESSVFDQRCEDF